MNVDKHIRVFDFIAPLYALFFRIQLPMYGRRVEKIMQHLKINGDSSLIDFGCGTGALSLALRKRGFSVVGVDGSEKMLHHAQRLCRDNKLIFVKHDITAPLDFPDKTFDVVISSFVMHGFTKPYREKIFAEMKRLARRHVILIDFDDRSGAWIRFIERMEGSDFENFIRQINGEMKEHFSSFEILDNGHGTSVYVGTL